MIIRPGTLAEVLQLVRDGEPFRLCLVGFLDAFYTSGSDAERRQRLEDDPGLAGDAKTDALIGAVAEHLCQRWSLGRPPHWVEQPERFLDRPWFMGAERMKGFLLAESPSAFRRRFIFTELEPLRRATMPKDRIWWELEGVRTGLQPVSAQDVEDMYGRVPS
jgi:hypothetical protein